MPKRAWRGCDSSPGPRRRADQREGRQVHLDRPRHRALADHDVEPEVLHRGIEDLLDRGREAVDLVDEEDVLRLEVREEAREIPGPRDHRARPSGAGPPPSPAPRCGRASSCRARAGPSAARDRAARRARAPPPGRPRGSRGPWSGRCTRPSVCGRSCGSTAASSSRAVPARISLVSLRSVRAEVYRQPERQPTKRFLQEVARSPAGAPPRAMASTARSASAFR